MTPPLEGMGFTFPEDDNRPVARRALESVLVAVKTDRGAMIQNHPIP